MKTDDNSMGKGCHSFSGNLDVGNKIDKFSYRLGIGGVYYTEREYDDADDKITGGHELSLYSDFQYSLNDSFLLRGGCSYTLSTPLTDKSPSVDGTIKIDFIHQFVASIGAGYQIVPEHCLINANLSVTKTLNYNQKYNDSDGSSMSLKYEKVYGFGVDLSAKFQF
jgi:hypothetical protein